MATYTKVSRSTPDSQRTAIITNVATGDRIDLVDLLGRPARTLVFQMTDTTDIVTYKINHLRRQHAPRTREESFTRADQVFGVFGKDLISNWDTHSDIFTGTGATSLEISDGLRISSIEIVSLTLADPSGVVISIEVN